MNKSGNQKGNLSYLAGTKKRSDSLIESRSGSASGGTTMTFLKERERSDDNDARAFLLSNTAEERVEGLGIFMIDRSLALRLNGPWAASSEDGPRRSSFHKAGRERKTQDARALFLTTRLEERAEFSGSSPIALSSAHQRRDIAKFFSRSHDALSRVYDDAAGSVIETHEHAGDFKEP